MEICDQYVVLDKSYFVQKFKKYLEPEQEYELLGGYYDGCEFDIPKLGITVGIENRDVVIRKEDWEKIKDKL